MSPYYFKEQNLRKKTRFLNRQDAKNAKNGKDEKLKTWRSWRLAVQSVGLRVLPRWVEVLISAIRLDRSSESDTMETDHPLIKTSIVYTDEIFKNQVYSLCIFTTIVQIIQYHKHKNLMHYVL